MHGVELMREHTPDGTRLHHTVTSGGGAANVVPEFAEGFFYVRHPKAEEVKKLYPRLLKSASAALATETQLEVVYLGGTMEIPPNELPQAMKKNLTTLNDLKYDDTEVKFRGAAGGDVSGQGSAHRRHQAGVRSVWEVERRQYGRG